VQVIAHNPVALGEGGELVIVHPTVGDALVEEHESRTRSSDLIVERCSAHLDKPRV
jgi:hypothetical protein